jgi:Lar family restriction alleviation protein
MVVVNHERKQCPFCGGKSLYVNDAGFINTGFSVICENCGATGPIEENEEMALKAWNRDIK